MSRQLCDLCTKLLALTYQIRFALYMYRGHKVAYTVVLQKGLQSVPEIRSIGVFFHSDCLGFPQFFI